MSRLLRKEADERHARGSADATREMRDAPARAFRRLADDWTPTLHASLALGIALGVLDTFGGVWSAGCTALAATAIQGEPVRHGNDGE